MTEPNFPEQAKRLEGLLRKSHLTEEEFASRVFVKVETFRKYLAGYQRAGKRLLTQMDQVSSWEEERLKRAATGAKQEGDALHEELVAYAGKLLELPEPKRDLAKKLIDELGDKPASCAGGEPHIEDIAAQTGIDEVGGLSPERAGSAGTNEHKRPRGRTVEKGKGGG